MKGKKHNQTGNMIILVLVFLLIFNTTLGYVMTAKAKAALISLIQKRMLDISNTAAAMLDGDALASLTTNDKDSAEYKEIMRILTYYQDNIELKYIYCIKDMGNKNFVFSVDPTVEDPGARATADAARCPSWERCGGGQTCGCSSPAAESTRPRPWKRSRRSASCSATCGN